MHMGAIAQDSRPDMELHVADSLYQRERFADALLRYQLTFRGAAARGDTATMARASCMIGVIHGRTGAGDKATEYLGAAARMATALQDTTLLIRCLKGLGNVCELNGDHACARSHFQEALLVARASHDRTAELQLLNNIGVTCTKSGDLDMADGHLRNALGMAERMQDSTGMLMTLSNLGNNMVIQGRAHASLPTLQRALAIAQRLHAVEDEATVLEQRAEAYRRMGEPGRAFDDFVRFHDLEDSLARARNTARMADLEIDHQLALKRAQLAQMQAEQEKGALSLAAEQERAGRQRWIIVLVGLLAMTALGGLYHVMRRARTIRSLNRELSDNLDENEHLRTLIKQDLDHYRSIALRKRMNPHFVFNCLNSIQGAILHEDRKTASVRLSRFAQLMRRMLDLADKDLVPVVLELEVLDMYVELESQRFNGSFRFTKADHSGRDLARLAIPPMLLQPHIENAIHHGLLAATGDRELRMEVAAGNGTLEFTIEDNGIGRSAARARAQREAGTHRSVGSSLTAERLELLQGMHGGQVLQRVDDLAHADGSPAGTRVRLVLPLIPIEHAGRWND